MKLDCPKIGRCGGCPEGTKTLSEQHAMKLAPVAFLHENVRFRYTPMDRVRDRADLVWETVDENGTMHLGLYGLKSTVTEDLPACPMMSLSLENFFKEFRTRAPKGVKKGSVRLRVSPSGERGIWLDFANQDVKALFDEREYLRFLSGLGFVEIGQRRKALEWQGEQPKLRNPVLKPWFETYGAKGESIPLYGPVGGFSQTGFAANKALVSAVCELVEASKQTEWLELFSGHGNFALALAARGIHVEAMEVDELALTGMEMSLAERSDLKPFVRFSRADVYLQEKKVPALKDRGLLVDPPRAGLRELLKRLRSGDQPKFLLYVSCHSESFLRDSRELLEMGYKVSELVGIDQFPHSNHSEWVALFSR